MSYKICSKCGLRKHKGKSFVKDSSKSDGVYSSCKDCYRARVGTKKRLRPYRVRRGSGEKLKLCGACHKYKDLEKFYPNRSTKDHLHTACKTCTIRQGRSEAAKVARKGVRQRERMVVLMHYGGMPPKCACCGEASNEFLAIDHIKGGGNAHRRSVGHHFYRKLIQSGFPKGLRVLCHNCNLARGFYGACPHEGKGERDEAV